MDWKDVLGVGFYGTWILGCLTCVVSFGFCLAWAIKGDHPLMLSLNAPYRPNWKQKVLLIGAASFLLVAMYQGGTAFFEWIPSDWGTIDEDGDFKTYQEAIGAAIGMICGVALLHYLNASFAREMVLRAAATEIEMLRKIYDETSIPATISVKLNALWVTFTSRSVTIFAIAYVVAPRTSFFQ